MKIEKIAIIELVIILVLLIAFGSTNKKAKKYETQLKQIQGTGQIEQPEEENTENGEDKDNTENGNDEENEDETDGESEEEIAKNNQKRLEQEREQQNKGPIVKSLGGTDQKQGLFTQNVRLETENGKSKLYVEVVNNYVEPITNMPITISLIDANRKEVGEYTNTISSIAPTQIMTLEFDVTNVDKVEGYYLK